MSKETSLEVIAPEGVANWEVNGLAACALLSVFLCLRHLALVFIDSSLSLNLVHSSEISLDSSSLLGIEVWVLNSNVIVVAEAFDFIVSVVIQPWVLDSHVIVIMEGFGLLVINATVVIHDISITFVRELQVAVVRVIVPELNFHVFVIVALVR